MNDKYILDAQNRVVAEPDLLKWGRWFETSRDQRVVKQEVVGDTKVSTVFLGLNHNYGDGPPLLWETLCFGGKMNDEMDRCSGNREQAEAMHQRMVEKVKQSC